jgi:hypothetical protein
MTPQELAAQLDGRNYREEITDDEANAAYDAGLVVVFGASDDLVELRGKIDNEVGAYNGTTIYLTSAGLLENECNDDGCPYFEKLKESASAIEAQFDKDGYTWTYKTAIPHAVFDITEDGEKYCRGIVFALADVKGGAA